MKTLLFCTVENTQFSFFRYMSAAKSGDIVTITAEALKVGKTMAFTTAELKLNDGTVIARGNHTKHLGAPLPKL